MEIWLRIDFSACDYIQWSLESNRRRGLTTTNWQDERSRKIHCHQPILLVLIYDNIDHMYSIIYVTKIIVFHNHKTTELHNTYSHACKIVQTNKSDSGESIGLPWWCSLSLFIQMLIGRSGTAISYNITYRCVSARKTQLQCVSNAVTSSLHSPMDII